MKNVFKSSFHPRNTYIFVLTSGHVEKQLDKKAEVNFKTYDVTNSLADK